MALDLERFDRLPSIPGVAVQILGSFADPDVPLTEIEKLVAVDPALSAKLLRAANSAQFGGGRSVTDLSRAVGLLGRTRVTSLVLCFSLSEPASTDKSLAGLYRHVWLQALIQAIAAGLIGRRRTPRTDAEFFLAGLLAQIGELAILKAVPQEYARLAESTTDERERVTQILPFINGSADQLTAELLTRWELPPQFAAAVSRRWSSIEELKTGGEDSGAMSQAVAVATAIAAYMCDVEKAQSYLRLTQLATDLLGFSGDALQSFLGDVQRQLREDSHLLQTDIRSLGTPSEIMAEAMDQLARLCAEAAPHSLLEERRALLEENAQLKKMADEIFRKSTIDPLTQLFNRRHFDGQLPLAIQAARESHQSVALLFLDLDHFKAVNDRFGHAAGDDVLRMTARVLTHTARRGDLVSRYGGEEFVILCSNATMEGLQAFAERIRTAIENEPVRAGGQPLKISVSVGGALLPPSATNTREAELLDAADRAMYRAKQRGRNCCEIVDVQAP